MERPSENCNNNVEGNLRHVREARVRIDPSNFLSPRPIVSGGKSTATGGLLAYGDDSFARNTRGVYSRF